MSRTDVHRPWRVQVTDPFNRHRLYRHYPWSATSEIEWYPLYQACGCDMCTGRNGRRRNRRKERALAKNGCREALKLGREDVLDWDPLLVVPPYYFW